MEARSETIGTIFVRDGAMTSTDICVHVLNHSGKSRVIGDEQRVVVRLSGGTDQFDSL